MSDKMWLVVVAALAGSWVPDLFRTRSWWARMLVAAGAGLAVWLVFKLIP